MMASTGLMLAKFKTKGATTGGMEWVHYSIGTKSAKIRRFQAGGQEIKLEIAEEPTKSLDAVFKDLKIQHLLSWAAIRSLLPGMNIPPKGYKCSDENKLTEVAGALSKSANKLPKYGIGTKEDRTALREILRIPTTRIRHAYGMLRDIGGPESHRQICKAMIRNPFALANALTLSYQCFMQYDNSSDAFHNNNRKPLQMKTPNPTRNVFANNLKLQVESEETLPVVSPHDAAYVDYEVSPLRTKRAQFDDGRSGKSSGGGGIDLLLCDKQCGCPVIGEIKAKNDSTMFLALIQALTYAVEMTTPNQSARLLKAYKKKCPNLKDSGQCDIYLIFEGENPPLLMETKELAKKLMASAKVNFIRRIVFIKGTDSNGRITLTVESEYP